MERSCQVSVLITDFLKVFDRVCHILLIHKLFHYGILKKLNLWTEHFLVDRRQSELVGRIHIGVCSSRIRRTPGFSPRTNVVTAVH